jgi:DNA processing protein
MAVPGNITSPTSIGTNQLIRDGAEPLLVLDDLLAHYPEAGSAVVKDVATPQQPTVPDGLAAPESLIFTLLVEGDRAIDDLIARSNLPSHEALAAISGLELLGHATQERGVVKLVR